MFTRFLVEGLQGGADGNGDGVVTLQEVGRYVQQKVAQWAAAHGHRQDPRLSGEEMGGDLPLAVNSQAKARHDREQRVKKIYQLLEPAEAQEARRLHDADPAKLSDRDRRLRSYLDNLLDGTISVETYRDAVRALSDR